MSEIRIAGHELAGGMQNAGGGSDIFFMPFVKMHGCGNDYIFFDLFSAKMRDPEETARVLTDRNTGIGGDGIVLICPSDIADAKIRVFNRDGSIAEMCGNAIRCVGKYLYETGKTTKTEINIETLSGVKELELIFEAGNISAVRVNMGKAVTSAEEIPVRLYGDSIIGREVFIGGLPFEITCVSMGNPHAVIFHEDIDLFDLAAVGPRIEHASLFPERVNLEVAEMMSRNHIKMRVWERGTGETLSCGTGACAAVVAAVLMGYCDKGTDIRVTLRGGSLTVNYTDEAVYLTGEAVKIFEGMVEV